MPASNAELKKLVAQSRDKVEKKHRLVQLANRRIAKWEHKRRAHRKHSPAWTRAQKKVVFWKRRKHDSIYLAHHWQHVLSDALATLASRKPHGLVAWAKKYIGTHEGSARQVEWAHNLGYSASLPWCSIFVANGIKETYHLALPANPAYSGAWMAWQQGRRIAIGNRQRDDLLIYDWGDGGMTDHVAIYAPPAPSRLGGNQDDAVTETDLDEQFIVAVVRPRTSS